MPDVVPFPRPMTDNQVAELLGVSVHTVRRERKRGALGHVIIGGRPRYLPRHLEAYLNERDMKPCHESARIDRVRLETTGVPGAPTRPSGAGPGSIPPADRRAAHRLALTILQPPSSPSPDGSRSTGTAPRSNRAMC